jgi:hypothetical protein
VGCHPAAGCHPVATVLRASKGDENLAKQTNFEREQNLVGIYVIRISAGPKESQESKHSSSSSTKSAFQPRGMH